MGDGEERAKRFFQRIGELSATDPQFAAAAPDPAVVEAVSDPSLSFTRYLDTLMRGYAERPALAHRVGAGYETISYGELWARVGAIAAAWQADGLAPGDFVATVGFTSPDYVAVDLAAARSGLVSVPLQAGASLAQLVGILEETEPKVLAASASSLEGAVACALAAPSVQRLVVFDLRGPDASESAADERRGALADAEEQLARAGRAVVVETLADLAARGEALPEAPLFEPAEGEDPLALLIYTSGSTGAPKGAMYSQRLVSQLWGRTPVVPGMPNISLHYMPLSHSYGRAVLAGALSAGGTAHFTANSDLSTLFEDIALARPTFLALVPRVCEMLFQESQRGQDVAELRERVLGGRLLVAVCGSAPLSPEMRAFMEEVLGFPLLDGYGSTEALGVMRNGIIQRPPVIDYKLVDVPELGYRTTDKPYPRGELCIRSTSLISGYYKRPEITAEVFDAQGYYKTGDVMAEIAPDHLVYVDRSKNVLKLSQGEFVAVAKLEAAYGTSPYVKQIFVYGNSERSFLLAVVVPNAEVLGARDQEEAKPLIAASLQKIAKEAGLQSYEVPRDFLIETEPFTTQNGLLSEVGKLLRPKLKARYGEALEARYDEIAHGQADELRALRDGAGQRPVVETVVRAAVAISGSEGAEVGPEANFADLGGDSLSALSLANLLHDVFEVEVPVRIIIGPTASLAGIAKHIEAERAGASAPTAASVHGAGATRIRASELTLEKFLPEDLLAAAKGLPAADQVRTVLLTGANGWLGRFLALEQLERLARSGQDGGKLICLVRGKDAAAARRRIEETLGTDPALAARFAELAEGRLEVVPGDVGEPKFGLDDAAWDRLAEEVDVIVHPAALVNHVLPYHQLFGPNVVGTAEIIRLAITAKRKPVTYLSTVAVAAGVEPSSFEEDGDIRAVVPERPLGDGYANGYGNSKWAGEVLLREAHELVGLPVAVFRSDMILAHTRYTGQLNVPDQFTRLVLSLLATGIAPKSFYQQGAAGERQRAHYDGIPVDFTAEAITTLGAEPSWFDGGAGFRSFDVFNPHHDGVGLDEFVDWLIEAGHPISRIDDHKEWFARFETAVRGLPEAQRQHSLLPLLRAYSFPHPPVDGSVYPTGKFQGAVKAAQVGSDHDVPHLGKALIVKYADDLKALGLL
ncbi:carboxylic acid reductase [Segniliparus rugosus]|uniref:Carboxylic acid reductase n=1 Tax=Segniliparus rugosus (strain ATCC BAA-974 / DSM 45345 / CCUG 50838 / CIP 108380 / JCM 13579 / CDC 945) TaxID=679197 RepID=E5XUS9_SEGRC|nr:carboxylic acid reductase [Segniliparus rugosus]EFV11917.1 thioester reductase domain-containing protein [Segniliparus rugosus ATCC BAA-974]